MMMEQNKKVPAIRFKGFEKEWEMEKLGKIGYTYTGLSGKTKEDFGCGEGKFITYMNVFSNPISSCKQLEKVGIDNSQNQVQYGDVLFTTSSETPQEVGMSSVWLHNLKNIYLNSFCFGYRPQNDIESFYLAYLLRSNSFRSKMTPLAQGISRYNLSKGKVMDLSIPFPQKKEQTQIGNFFKTIDEQITLHEQKHQKLLNLKSAMLEKMFPKEGANVPEIRFEGFTDEWIIDKMSEVFNFNISTNSLSRIQLDEKNGQILNVHYGDILVKYSTVLDLEKNKVIPYIKDGKLRDYKNQFLKDGDIVFADAAEDLIVGKAVEIYNVKNNYIVSGLHTIVARPIFYFEKYFLGYYLNSFSYRKQLIAMSQGTKVLSLSKTNFKNTIIKYPDILEQQKIGAYFENLDHLISQSQTQINKYKNIKQALLQKMFV